MEAWYIEKLTKDTIKEIYLKQNITSNAKER